jgi:hypothetical protein
MQVDFWGYCLYPAHVTGLTYTLGLEA